MCGCDCHLTAVPVRICGCCSASGVVLPGASWTDSWADVWPPRARAYAAMDLRDCPVCSATVQAAHLRRASDPDIVRKLRALMPDPVIVYSMILEVCWDCYDLAVA